MRRLEVSKAIERVLKSGRLVRMRYTTSGGSEEKSMVSKAEDVKEHVIY